MLLIHKLRYNIGNFPVILENHTFEEGTINLIYGKNSSGKTSFCEAITSCNLSNEIYLNRNNITTKDFVYFTSSSPSFFGINGLDLLRNYGGKMSEARLKALTSLINLPFDKPIETYSHSIKKIMQFLWVLTFERKVYIFDDLFQLLDEENTLKIKSALKLLKEELKIILVTTNRLDVLGDIADGIYDLPHKPLIPNEPIFEY
jgi:ABC-type multidrug transport system ATPase subunit